MFCYLCDLPESENKKDGGFHFFKEPRDNTTQVICDSCKGEIYKGSVFYFCDRCTEIKGTHISPVTKIYCDHGGQYSNFCKECWDEIEQDRDDNEADRAYKREEVKCQN